MNNIGGSKLKPLEVAIVWAITVGLCIGMVSCMRWAYGDFDERMTKYEKEAPSRLSRAKEVCNQEGGKWLPRFDKDNNLLGYNCK